MGGLRFLLKDEDMVLNFSDSLVDTFGKNLNLK